MLTVVIPALNEEKHLATVIDNVLHSSSETKCAPIEIIVVDDGSTDRTGEIIRDYEKRHPFIRSIRHERSRGMGASFLEAAGIARYDRITLFAGDNDVTREAMREFMSQAATAELVISYIVNVEDRGHFRAMLSALYSLIYATTFRLPIRYVHGAAVYPTAVLRGLGVRARGYSTFSEINTKILRSGVTFREIPLTINPDRRKSGAIRFRNLAEVIKTYVRLVFQVALPRGGRFSKLPRRVR